MIKCLCCGSHNLDFYQKISLSKIDKSLVFPGRILRAYGLHAKCAFWFDEEKEELFYPQKRKGKALKPMDGRPSEEIRLPDLKDAVRVCKKNVAAGRYSLKRKEWFPGRHKITISAGKNNFLKDSVCSADEKVFSINDYKEEFGANLYQYPYDTICYMQEEDSEENPIHYTKIAVPFLRRWDEDYNGKLELFVFADGVSYACPVRRTCEFDGEVIEPIKDSIQTVDVCEECHEDKEEIGEVIRLINNLVEACQTISKQNNDLANRVSKIEEQFVNV